MTLLCEIWVGGKLRGWCHCHTASDMLGAHTFPTREDAVASDFSKARECKHNDDREPWVVAKMTIFQAGEPTHKEPYEMRWCEECEALIMPPHDGYVEHDYGCTLEPCTCKGSQQ